MRRWRTVVSIAVLAFLAIALAGCDDTAVVVDITGVEDGAAYSEAVTPVIVVEPENAEVSITLNGQPYDGGPISENGDYTLTVTATLDDKSRSQSVSFKIMLGVSNYYLIDNFAGLDGFSTENDAALSHTTDPAFVKSAGGALKVTKSGSDARSMTRLRNYHARFVTDLTPYNRLGFWVYFPQASLLREDVALQVCFWLPSGGKINYTYPAADFVDGWNYVEVDLADPEKSFTRTSVDLIEFQVRTADGATAMDYYYDDIALWWRQD